MNQANNSRWSQSDTLYSKRSSATEPFSLRGGFAGPLGWLPLTCVQLVKLALQLFKFLPCLTELALCR
jgi:hypothetical protein